MNPNVVSTAYEFETLTVTNGAALALNPTKIEGGGRPATRVVLTVEAVAIRYRYDGLADPTTTTGHQVAVGASFEVNGPHDIRRLKLISTGANATVFATYERE